MKKGLVISKRWKLITLVVAIILISLPLGFRWYSYAHSPIYTARIFVKAIMNGDEKTIDHLNYTGRPYKTIKMDMNYKLKQYNFNDLVISVSPGDDKIHIKTVKNKDLYLRIEVVHMNNSYYITFIGF